MNLRDFNYTPHDLYRNTGSYGFIQSTCPKELKPKILKSIEDSTIPYQNHLVGQIKEEYLLDGINDDPEWQSFLMCGALAHESTFPGYWHGVRCTHKSESNLNIDSTWVNFMKKHEYNPLHHHYGVLSYVMWVQVPFTLEDERKLCPCAKENDAIAAFSFVFPGLQTVDQFNLPVDNSWEWEIVFFPAQLHHMVYPFQTSDDTRISISGNIYLD